MFKRRNLQMTKITQDSYNFRDFFFNLLYHIYFNLFFTFYQPWGKIIYRVLRILTKYSFSLKQDLLHTLTYIFYKFLPITYYTSCTAFISLLIVYFNCKYSLRTCKCISIFYSQATRHALKTCELSTISSFLYFCVIVFFRNIFSLK